jgi:hypothetical protein
MISLKTPDQHRYIGQLDPNPHPAMVVDRNKKVDDVDFVCQNTRERAIRGNGDLGKDGRSGVDRKPESELG